MEGIEPVQTAEATATTARTLLCNRCALPIFGDNQVQPTQCCAELFCNFCWEKIERDAERCPQPGCNNVFLKAVPIYWAEDTDQESKNRDIRSQVMAARNPTLQALVADAAVLKGRIARQKQQISDKECIQGALDDQIRSIAGRLETTRKETDTISGFIEATQARTNEVLTNNNELAAKIARLNEQIANVEREVAARNAAG
ncbi:hypothetical protein EST38_g2587 [Candolleomyces aberdarensis]|uniref:RING-type domain-containing protein n=1 Tax=Candolleomyces aberdarensis TaxID=2316362 RepID=A0A4Q2DSH5_9AGAR|nr:hypothetical protein EST38_g2587 [Candolleomyces aberdarensis]